MRRIAVYEVDPLEHDAPGPGLAPQAVHGPAGEPARIACAVLGDDERRASLDLPAWIGARAQLNAGNLMQGARRRRLRVAVAALEPRDPHRKQRPRLVEKGERFPRRALLGARRHPVDRIAGEELEPFAEAPLVEQPCLLEQELLDLVFHGQAR